MGNMGILTYACKKCKKNTIDIFEIWQRNFKPDVFHTCMHCQGSAKLIEYIPPRQGKKILTGGHTHFEPAFGKEINTKDIDKLCKEHGVVYGGDDLTREAHANKSYNENKFNHELRTGLNNELGQIGL